MNYFPFDILSCPSQNPKSQIKLDVLTPVFWSKKDNSYIVYFRWLNEISSGKKIKRIIPIYVS